MSIDNLLKENRVFKASSEFKEKAHFLDSQLYTKADQDRLGFWEEQANALTWTEKWTSVLDWQRPYAKWFVGGTLNASYNCLDVHLENQLKKPAIIWEGELGDIKILTYESLHQQTCQFAAALKSQFHIQKGDRITLYMPMIPEAVIAILACARMVWYLSQRSDK
ncbi:MAG: AMP-binding protein [Candidatus Margulisbacteria bacterium]|nr:AMP-binding protein [Candidatus Margulisiibacteriota bacterium]